MAPHQGVSAGLRRLAEGCRDAQSSVSPGVPRGATDAHSSWPGFGGLLHTHTGAAACGLLLNVDRGGHSELNVELRERDRSSWEASAAPPQLLQACISVQWVTLGILRVATRVDQGLVAVGQGCGAEQPLIRSLAGLGVYCFSFKGKKNEHCILGVLFGRRIPRIVILFKASVISASM